MQTVLIWAFGILAATIMLSTVVRRRHDHLVGLLKDHVKEETGLTDQSDSDETPSKNQKS